MFICLFLNKSKKNAHGYLIYGYLVVTKYMEYVVT